MRRRTLFHFGKGYQFNKLLKHCLAFCPSRMAISWVTIAYGSVLNCWIASGNLFFLDRICLRKTGIQTPSMRLQIIVLDFEFFEKRWSRIRQSGDCSWEATCPPVLLIYDIQASSMIACINSGLVSCSYNQTKRKEQKPWNIIDGYSVPSVLFYLNHQSVPFC